MNMEKKKKVIISAVVVALFVLLALGYFLGWFGKKKASPLDSNSMKGEVDMGAPVNVDM